MRVLSFPFRFNPGQPSTFATYEFDSNEYKAQQVEAFMRTQRKHRPIFADFGINDPTFASGKIADSFNDTTFVSEFATFYGNIVLNKVNVTSGRGVLTAIEIEFS